MRHHLQNCPVEYDDNVKKKLTHPKLLPMIDSAPDRSQPVSHCRSVLGSDRSKKVSFQVPVVAGVRWCQANPLSPCFSVSLLLNGYWPHSIMCLALCAACPYLVDEGALAHSTAEDSHLPVRSAQWRLTRHTLFARWSHNLVDYSEPTVVSGSSL